MDIVSRIYEIELGLSRQKVEDSLDSLYVGWNEYDDNLETDRLDHAYDTSCKCMTFTFDGKDELINIEEVF